MKYEFCIENNSRPGGSRELDIIFMFIRGALNNELVNLGILKQN